MIEWLIKYPWDWFARGSLALTWSPAAYLLALVVLAALLFLLAGFRRHRALLRLLPLRLLMLAVLLLALAQPVLVVDLPEPGRGRVAVLLDDSLSMRIGGADGVAPAGRLAELLGAPEGPLRAGLAARFDVRYHAYGRGLRPLAEGQAPTHDEALADLGSALLAVAGGRQAEGLAGVVVVGDGQPAAGDPQALEQALASLQAAGLAVQVLDLGVPDTRPDVEIPLLRLPASSLQGDRVEAEIEIRQQGAAGQTARLTIDDDGLVLASRDVVLPADGEPLLLRETLHFAEPGLRRVGASVAPLAAGEARLENNRMARSHQVLRGPLRVLHVEAEPRFEVKFLRRAVAADKGIRLASLVRTAENKYYRLGMPAPSAQDEARAGEGLPINDLDLLDYQVLVLGSVAADVLGAAQQELIRDFVARRGGGLLLLGGRQAFAEGGHARGALAELMPVHLDAPDDGFLRRVRLQAALQARAEPLLDFGPAESLEQLLQRMPALTLVNPLRRAKPGARILLQAPQADGEALIVMAAQRYGRGRVLSFAVRDSWRWQMHASVPVEDQSHERLWRQMLRDLGRDAGGRIRIEAGAAQAIAGAPYRIEAEVLDQWYRPLAGAEPRLRVTDPLGREQQLPMTPSAGLAGRYEALLVPAAAGRFEYQVELETPDGLRQSPGFVDVSAEGREYLHLAGGGIDLAGIAARTGGQVLAATAVGRLPGLIQPQAGGRQVSRSLPLWDAPLWLLLLLAAACGEWTLRRRGRLE